MSPLFESRRITVSTEVKIFGHFTVRPESCEAGCNAGPYRQEVPRDETPKTFEWPSSETNQTMKVHDGVLNALRPPGPGRNGGVNKTEFETQKSTTPRDSRLEVGQKQQTRSRRYSVNTIRVPGGVEAGCRGREARAHQGGKSKWVSRTEETM